MCEWIHTAHNVPTQEHFDECVANVYSREHREYLPEHTDQNRLLGNTSDILSLTLGAAGVFYWKPSDTGSLRQGGKQAFKRADNAKTDGL